MMQKMYSAQWVTWLLLPLLAFVVSCNNDDEDAEPPRPDENILEIISQTEGLDSLRSLIDPNGGLASRLSTTEHTVFAPNNEAFIDLLEAIGLDNMSELRNDLLSDILFYHLVPNAAYTSSEIDSALTTLDLAQIFPTLEGDSIQLNAATQLSPTFVVSADLLASNGVIHVIDQVLLTPSLTASGTTTPSIASTFGTVAGLIATLPNLSETSAVIRASSALSNLTNSGSNYVVLSPVDGFLGGISFASDQDVSNFVNFFAGLHIIETNTLPIDFERNITTLGGQSLFVTQFQGTTFINGAPTGDFNDVSSNGRVLYMNSFVPQPVALNSAIRSFEGSGETFNVLQNALAATQLDLGTGRTVFIPTDSAFLAAGLISVVDSTARIDDSVLANILQTHVIDGINFAIDVVASGSLEVPALNGTILSISFGENTGVTIDDGNPETDNADVILTDGYTDVGVVHVIDQVLLPNP